MTEHENKLERFLKFESENDLFKYKYKGVYFWALIRIPIYVKYFIKTENAHPDQKLKSPGDENKYKKHIFKHIINRIMLKKKDILCVEPNFYKIINDNRINPFVDFLKEINFSTHYHTRYNYMLSDDIIYPGTNDSLLQLTKFLLYVKFNNLKIKTGIKKIKKDSEIVECLDTLRKKLNINFDENYEYRIMAMVQDFILYKKVFKKLIKNKFKCVIFHCYYNTENMALISAARELNVPSIELQHGVIGKEHYAYNFIDMRSENKYLPDYIFTFGDYWTDTMRVPCGTIPISVGFPQIDLSRDYLKNVTQKQKTIVFYSQGTIGHELSQLALKFTEIACENGYTVKYKLHPSECKSWKTLYPDLLCYEKIEVLDQPINVHEILASAKFHIGVNSTVLFEALAFDGIVFAYNINGVSYMNDLIEMGYVQLFNDETELLHLIENGSGYVENKVISENLFKHNSVKNIENEIHKIIN